MNWSESEIERAKDLCIKQGLSRGVAARVLSLEFNREITRNAVTGILNRHTNFAPSRLTARSTKHLVRKFTPAPSAPQTNSLGKPIGPPLDLSVLRLLKDDDDVVPPEDAQGLFSIIDGKIHANDKMTDRSCRWIYGDPLNNIECFCGKETLASGVSYCAGHYPLVFTPAPVRVRPKPQEVSEPVMEVVES